MAEKRYYLNEQDVDTLKEMLREFRNRQRNQLPQELLEPDSYTPEVYFASLNGALAAMTGTTPGSTAATLYQLVNGSLVQITRSVTIYNPTASALLSGVYVLAVRDKFGRWSVTGGEGGGGGSSSLTVQDSTGTPAYAGITYISIDQGNGLLVTNPGSATASLALQAATNLLPGIITIGAQTFAGNKVFTGSTTTSGSFSVGVNAAIAGTLIVIGAATVTGATSITSTLNVGGAATITGATSITSNLAVGGSATITGSSSITGTLIVNGASTMTGATSITSTLNVGGAATITGATSITSTLGVGGNVTHAGTSLLTGATSVGTLTATRVVLAGVGGVLTDSSSLTFTAGTLGAGSATLTNPLLTTSGGTGLNTLAQGDIFYAAGTNTPSLTKLTKSTTAGQFLSNSGTNNNPAWATPAGGSGITITDGGTPCTGVTTISVEGAFIGVRCDGSGSATLTSPSGWRTLTVIDADTNLATLLSTGSANLHFVGATVSGSTDDATITVDPPTPDLPEPPYWWPVLDLRGTFVAELSDAADNFTLNIATWDSLGYLTFSGAAGSYGQSPAAMPIGTAERSISFWLNTTATSGTILQYGTDPSPNGEPPKTNFKVYLKSLDDDRVIAVQMESLTPSELVGMTVVDDGEWHHICIVVEPPTDANDVKLYVDRVLDAEWDSAFLDTADTDLFIGADGNDVSGSNCACKLLDIRVWDVALTAGEVRLLENTFTPILDPDVITDAMTGLPPNVTEAFYTQSEINSGDTIADTTSETLFARGSFVFTGSQDWDTFQVGDVVRVKAWGVYSTKALTTPSLTLKWVMDSTTLITTGALTTVGGLTNKGWFFEGYLTIYEIGGDGALDAQGYAFFGTAATTGLVVSEPNSSTISINAGASNGFNLKVTWGTADVANTITLRQMSVELLRNQNV